jgi:hypothetical protein
VKRQPSRKYFESDELELEGKRTMRPKIDPLGRTIFLEFE